MPPSLLFPRSKSLSSNGNADLQNRGIGCRLMKADSNSSDQPGDLIRLLESETTVVLCIVYWKRRRFSSFAVIYLLLSK
jgi:hypothetical protein